MGVQDCKKYTTEEIWLKINYYCQMLRKFVCDVCL